MNKQFQVKKMTLAAMFLALAYVLPFLTGQIPQIGAKLLPMHIPVLLCGYFCGGYWGFLVGLVAPLLRSLTLGVPPLFPKALCMAFELAAYGLVSGRLYGKLSKNTINVYVSLIGAMIVGRLVWGAAMFTCMGFNAGKFGLAAFLAGAVTNAIPGIVLQLVLIPILVITLKKAYQE